MTGQMLDEAGLKLRLRSSACNFVRSLPISSSIHDGICHLAESLPAASLSECFFNLATSSVTLPDFALHALDLPIGAGQVLKVTP